MAIESLSIIIVNWNAGRQLLGCISSIQAYGTPYVTQVVVVDNGSTDDSISLIYDIPNVRVILAGANLGFSKACNLGAQHAGSEFLLFLNPDAAIYEDTIPIALAFMRRPENSKVGICGVRLLDEYGATGTSAARFPTLGVLVGKNFALNRFLPRLFPAHLITADELPETTVVDQVIGAFFLIRKYVFDACEGFDERFFMYFEEVDLSLRARQLGYSSYFLSKATAYHKGGGCSESVKAARLFYSLRSRVIYAKKHYSAVSYVLLLFLTAIELPLRLTQSLIKRSWEDARNTLSAYRQLASYFFWRG